MINTLLAYLTKTLASIGAALVLFWSVYRSGKSAGANNEKIKALEETQDAIKRVHNARDNSRLESDRSGLFADDGFKRSN